MQLQWDWLGPRVTAPFVPTIGPVHPRAVAAKLFSDVIDVAGTGRFLGYDKDRRWFGAKAEAVLVEDIIHGPHGTLFPVLSRRGAGSVTVYVYGGTLKNRQIAGHLASELCSVHGAGSARVVWFPESDGSSAAGTQVTRIHLHEFSSEHRPIGPDHVRVLEECTGAVKATFIGLTTALAADGFEFLYGRMAAGTVGPVLVAVDEGSIVGAIGPLETMSDSTGATRMLPLYFGVLPDWRGRGYGRGLWRGAMGWGQRNGASYHLLQTVTGAAADHICRTEGLRSLGLVCRTAV